LRIIDPLNLGRLARSVELLYFRIKEGAEAARVLELGQDNRLARLALIIHARSHGNFLTQLITEVLDSGDGLAHAVSALSLLTWRTNPLTPDSAEYVLR
jgi:hypothetical protein